MQRRRVLAAAVQVVATQGVRGFSVAVVCEQAGLSRKTFYEVFRDREECLMAAFEAGVEDARLRIVAALQPGRSWREQVRLGLSALLSFFDAEPAMARLLVVEALSAGSATLSVRHRVLQELASHVERGREDQAARRGAPPPLTSEGMVGAVFSVIHARMVQHVGSPLSEMTGTLTAMIVHPYLGPAAARAELKHVAEHRAHPKPRSVASPFKDLPIRLTYRTALVLRSIGETPGASSRQIAAAAGIVDAGQASRLLIRLEKAGLIRNGAEGPRGAPKSWALTERGDGVVQVLDRG